ncbi:hypothetical protein Afe04nite_39800 [Asanoa ferruginea]|nr:hypothetical protein Afe04nite_39800 [Asanoa ferruginea]
MPPGLHGGFDAECEREKAEIRHGALGQERGTERGGHGDRENARETEILACADVAGGVAVPGALGEEEREDQDVVDVGDGEQAGGLADDA